ncbi:MAG: glycosyltransferase family 2 protein [Actinobacteria bacterium]|nr:glycosyltransferase family 2 protein [Actinomycetota bacterium]
MTPKVTICVPVYNSASTIEKALTSAMQQSYGDFECLVIDNASTDSTFERAIAFGDSRIRVLRNTVNVGVVANENRCIREATGELIQFLHGDDWLLPDCLSRLVPTFEDPGVGLAFARRRIESEDPKWAALIGTLHTPLEPLGNINAGMEIVRKYVRGGSRGNWIGEPTSVMVRRSLLAAVGGFDPRQRSYSDMELWLRVLARSNAAWVDEELSVRVQHDASLSAQYEETDESWLDRPWILAGLAHDPHLDPDIRSKAWRQWIIAVAKKLVRTQLATGAVRRARYRELGSHVRQSLVWDNSWCPLNVA